MAQLFQFFGEQPRHQWSGCSMPLDRVYVRRTTEAPTAHFSFDKGTLGFSLTPYRLAEQLGIKVYRHADVDLQARLDIMAGRAMDVHYSFVSYLWALRYYGIDPVILEWPNRRAAPTTLVHGEPVWHGPTYRPSYAMVALMWIAHSNLEWEGLCNEFLSLKPEQRVPMLKRLATWYIQNPVDSFGANGFHHLTSDFGIEVNP